MNRSILKGLSIHESDHTETTKRIPVPDPGVPPCLRRTPQLHLPQVGHQWTICLCAGLHNSPSPYINKLTGHVSIQVCTYVYCFSMIVGKRTDRRGTTKCNTKLLPVAAPKRA
ncbi:hypothetical protein ACLKA6_003291 [Drosophila palustris]